MRRAIVNPPLSENRGRIFKLMGDPMLAEFASAVKSRFGPCPNDRAFGEPQ
jgi:class 3 adenylate cyclase